jgi:thiol-disulfide isomerase/thioredoxin
MDSTLVADGRFTFTGSVDTAVLSRLMLNRRFVDLILENGKISVDIMAPNSVIGTPLNEELSKYLTELTVINETDMKAHNANRQNQDIDEEARQKKYEEYVLQWKANIEALHLRFFNANKNNTLGSFVLWQWSNSLDMEPDRFDALYSQAGDVVRKFKLFQSMIERIAKLKQTAEGMHFTDFTIENGNKDGSKASFSDYVGKGKYVLVDFWGSWCGPCIDEIPVLVEVYNKYKGDKFEILGIAVRDKREATLKAIETYKIPWPQILDAGDIPTNLYGIHGFPHIILFGPDGKIIARQLRGDQLKAKMVEVMQ